MENNNLKFSTPQGEILFCFLAAAEANVREDEAKFIAAKERLIATKAKRDDARKAWCEYCNNWCKKVSG